MQDRNMAHALAETLIDELEYHSSGDRLSVGGEIVRTRPDRPWGPPSLLYNGYRLFPGGIAAGAWR